MDLAALSSVACAEEAGDEEFVILMALVGRFVLALVLEVFEDDVGDGDVDFFPTLKPLFGGDFGEGVALLESLIDRAEELDDVDTEAGEESGLWW